MTKKVDRKLQSAVSAAIGTRARKIERIPGFLGTFVDGEKTVRVPNRKDFVFVRLRMDQSEVIEAFNDQVGDLFGIPVTVIRDESAPRFYRVVSREIDTFQDYGNPGLVNHAEQHMFAGGTGTVASDVVWVYRRAFVPLGVSPNGTMTANVASDYYIWDTTVKHFGPTGTVDFTSIRDSLGVFEARFVTVFLNGNTNELNYITGEIFDNTIVVTDPTEFISVPDPDDGFPLAAVYLFNSMTQVLWKDIFDIRQIIQGIGGATGGATVNWGNVEIVAVSGGDHTTITAALAAASSGDIVLVMPGTYTESITLVAGVTVVGIANSTGPVIIAPAAGTVVTIPSGAGAYRLHNCTLTPPSSTACVTDNMGASGLATLYRVSIGTSGGGDSIDSSGGSASATLTLEECRLTGNFTQFSICDFIDCISASGINPAASAGDLTIYGGEVGAEIDDVSGQTVAFLNTPFIGGAVTGAGTLFGTYLNGVNELQVTDDITITDTLTVSSIPVTRIPYVGLVTVGLITSSADLTYNELAVTIRSESASNPRGIHAVQAINTASAGAQWTSSRARGTIATPIAVQADDVLGEFRFRGFDTTFTDTVAQVAAHASENFLTGSHGSYVTISTTPDGSDILTERIRITNEGFMGIGLGNPTDDIHLQRSGAAASVLLERYGGAPSFKFRTANGTLGTPTAVTSGNNLGRFNAFGYDGTAFGASADAGVFFKANENFSVGNHGTRVTIEATPDGSTSRGIVSTYHEGIQVGVPTGGDKGVGTINVATDIYKNNTAYTNPDHVLEHWATGRIRKHRSKQAGSYKGLMVLNELRSHLQKYHRLPRIGDEPTGIFERGDIILEKVEELSLYILELHERISRLERH